MSKILTLATFFIFLYSFSFAQQDGKKIMSTNVYDEWREIKRTQVSNDGEWVSYINYHDKKDPILELFQNSTNRTYIFDRANEAKFTDDNQYLIYKLHAAKDSIRTLKRNKVKKKDLPKDSLCIVNLADQSKVVIPRVQDYSLPKYWNGHVFITQDPDSKDTTAENSTSLLIWDLVKNVSDTISHIDKYHLADRSPGLVLTRLERDSAHPTGIFYYDFGLGKLMNVLQRKGKYEQIAISSDAQKVAFLFDQDTSEIFHRPYELFHWNKTFRSPIKLAGNQPKFVDGKLRLSEKSKLNFSQNGNRLFFGVAPFELEKDSTLLDEEIVNVEVWTTQDHRTYPQQINQLKADQKETYSCVYNFKNGSFVQLETADIEHIDFQKDRNSDYALVFDETPGKKASSWEGFPIRKDVYSVNLNNGKKQKLIENLATYPELSPSGKYIYNYNRSDESWYAYNLKTSQAVKMAGPETTNFNNELHDLPIDEYGYGDGGWTANDEYFLAYDRYDTWKLDPSGKNKAVKITNGRSSKVIYRAIQLDRENRFFSNTENWLLHFQNEADRSEGYATYNPTTNTISPLIEGHSAYTRRPIKARDKNHIVFTRETFQIFPDLHLAKDFNFEKAKRISDINPQQSEYAWGTIESFSWNDYVGNPVKGMIVKPANFDPKKKYPLLVNFYERSSHRIHRYPKLFPHRSTINYAYYANRGYVIFNPDISYIDGEPGESCYRAVMSGVDALLKLGFVDEKNMGLQGHSWGGYQIAYLLTRTHRFKCAESGAPVVNMTSAYGGIRWGSGLSRMFQYEKTQSRLGATLWESPEVYIKNSPLFELDKMETPVLILHNDNDGAVPWYQGIEYFMSLRRLNKAAWFLNYNDEPHWPLKRQNREDFQLRMSQFFDHYLLGDDQPRWMKQGVPAINKGIDQALELSGSN